MRRPSTISPTDAKKIIVASGALNKQGKPAGSDAPEKQEKPSVFIGSSREGLTIAGHMQTHLQDVAECTIWNQGLFELGKATLSNLYDFINKFDFAVFVATPDDKVEIREERFISARDNIIFELGLFMGGLGTDRVIFVSASKIEDFRLPSDLDGITHATYDAHRKDGNMSAATGPACIKIKQHLAEKSEIPTLKRKTQGALTYVGAICFQQSNNVIEYLLVNSTQNRLIFPKGHMQSRDKSAVDSAMRLALKEAGARGRIINGKSKYINYYNEEVSVVHRIELFLLEITLVFDLNKTFRKPKWYKLDAAITSITSKRDYNTSYELARAMEWAEEEIQLYLKGFKTARGSSR
jgi:predicted nucleotide-binding protein